MAERCEVLRFNDAARAGRAFLHRALLVLLCFSAPALAVSTSHWTQSDESDFKAGTLHDVVATNLGELKLSRAVKNLLAENPKVSMVTSLAEAPDGSIYAGTAPEGVLLKITGDSVSTVATIDDAVSITALEVEPDGALLIGASGAKGQVYRIDKPGGKPYAIFSSKGVQYIWAIKELPDRTIYAATGPNGQLFAIHPYGASEEIYKSDENNLTALATDGKDLLYVGTDPDGLVVRVNRQTKESFVMYNADEEEITALALDGQGNLYAATGEAAGPAAQPTETTPEGESGRPESPAEVPLPSKQPTPPTPPPPPPPSPGQPPPIPQTTHIFLPRASDVRIIPVMFDGSDDNAEPSDDQPDQPTPPTQPTIPAQPSSDNSDNSGNAAQADNSAAPAKPSGNAVYKIDSEGFVTEIFREPVVIYSMIASGDVLLVGTGDDGEIYQINPIAEETVVVAKTDAKEVTAMLRARDGRIILGLSNTGGLATMTDGFASTGTYTSAVMDATQVSRFGVMQMHGTLPQGTSLTVSTRAGNVKDADAQGWTKWTPETPALEFLPITSPPARFLQYRITFSTTNDARTPTIKDVDVAYQLPHLAPVVRSIKITDAPPPGQTAPPAPPPPGTPKSPDNTRAGTGVQTITWEADDLDNDNLVYSLYFRLAPAGEWILLKDKLTDVTYNWDTRSVADGRYEVKVVASDALANEVGQGKIGSRISDVLVVVNTAPTIGDLKLTVNGTTASISLRVAAPASTVASMEYSLDSNEDWQTVLPVDYIFDKPDETVNFSVGDLSPGAHQITLRATDARGNIGYQTVTVNIAPAGR
ncbi:MAG TPA: hypothetical protein VL992_13205 [Tepidisphaeraceae bacterium]|nr:hypothetical protein [Tepidisphaeraceae bacterium]